MRSSSFFSVLIKRAFFALAACSLGGIALAKDELDPRLLSSAQTSNGLSTQPAVKLEKSMVRVSAAEPIGLTGRALTIDQVMQVAREDRKVVVSDESWARVARSHALLLSYARLGQPVYGLNRGVGLNKDQTPFSGDVIAPEVRALSEAFNRNMLLSHTVAYGPLVPADVVRAAMLIRLNTALFGGTGMQPEVVRQYAAFLNQGITPVIRGQGSVGAADITVLPQIALALMGEGEVFYRGQRMASAEALRTAGLGAAKPFAKDSLSMLSANAYGAALAVVAVSDAQALLNQADVVAALSLEGLDGNVAPFLAVTQAQRPFVGQSAAAHHIVSLLQGSSLWQRSEQRPLQDPLSFRSTAQIHGAARDALAALHAQLVVQINSSDDNPTVALDVRPATNATPQERRYFVTEGAVQGAILPSASFDPTVWAVSLEGVGIAMSHVAQSSAQRVLRLGDPAFTRLSRFLSPGGGVLAYTTIQKTVSSLSTEVRALSQPVSSDSLVLAGNIEDVASNAPLAAQRVAQQIKLVRTLLGIEAIHAAQAIDLRLQAEPTRTLGAGTGAFHKAFRAQVPFLDADRRLGTDIEKADLFLLTQAQPQTRP